MNRLVLINIFIFATGAVGLIAHPNIFSIIAMLMGAVSGALVWDRKP
jgi:hypothetical protein